VKRVEAAPIMASTATNQKQQAARENPRGCGAYELHDAVRKGDEATCTALLLNNSTVINKIDGTGSTPLHIAVGNGDRTMCELLLKYGADVNCEDRTGDSVLHLATKLGSVAMCKYLVEHRAAINERNVAGNTPLCEAVKRGSREVCELLINCGAKIHKRGQEGKTPLQLAQAMKDQVLYELLISAGADVTEADEMIPTVQKEKFEMFTTCLHLAAQAADESLCKYFLLNGANVNGTRTRLIDECEYEETPLHAATRSKSQAIVKLLLDHGADVNALDSDERTPIELLNAREDIDLCFYLAQRGAKKIFLLDYNKRDEDYEDLFLCSIRRYYRVSLLFAAIKKNRDDIFQGLLDLNIDPNPQPDKNGNLLVRILFAYLYLIFQGVIVLLPTPSSEPYPYCISASKCPPRCCYFEKGCGQVQKAFRRRDQPRYRRQGSQHLILKHFPDLL
jgi:ankyrin repeat protein